MRFRLHVTPNTIPVPFNHIHRLLGVLHKWLGPSNPEHDAMSIYSMDWLKGARAENGALHFPKGATWRLGFWGYDPARRLTEGILAAPELFCGMKVKSIEVVPWPDVESPHTFRVTSPVIARLHRPDRTQEYLLWDDPRADAVLTATLRAKMEDVGLADKHLTVTAAFNRTYSKAHAKLTTIKGIHHKGSICPVVISGTPEALAFAWTVGIGELTGSGFGSLQ